MTRSTSWIVAACALAITACVSTHRPEGSDLPLGAPTDAPDHFLVGELVGEDPTEPTPGTGCKNPMLDPRTGIRIRLARSSDGLGDYHVPDGAYGVGQDQVLRLDCATGRAIGIFRREKGT